jgi:hypothetical protein
VQVFSKTVNRDRRRLFGRGNGGERFVGEAARASGGEAHDLPYRNIRRRAAKAARTSEKGALVKPSEIRAPDYVAIVSYAYLKLKTWADTTAAWTLTKIWSSAERQLLSLKEISPD